MTQTTDEKIDRLTAVINKIVVAPIAPIAPIAPVLPIAPINNGDHDTLTTLVVSVANLDRKIDDKFNDIKSDIKSINDGTSYKINDHEKRIRTSEISITQIKTYGTALLFLVGVAEFIILKLFR